MIQSKSTKNYKEIDKEGNIKVLSGGFHKKLALKKKLNLDYLNVGYYIITPLLVGVFLGLGLDSWLKTKPMFTAIFLFFGTAACFYNLLKLLKNGK